MEGIDQVSLHFSPGGLRVLNAILGLVMFGVALELKVADFRRLVTQPRGVLTGLAAQWILLPALTLGLTLWWAPPPSVALGMILVAACPGGNVSNFLTALGRGDVGLSVTITSVSTLIAALATPLNLAFWGSLNPATAPLLRAVQLDLGELLGAVALLLLAPLALGMLLAARRPALTARLRGPLKLISLLIFAAFLGVALWNNRGPFVDHIGQIFLLVLAHNGVAFSVGYLTARLARLPVPERRAVTMEVGIQNSGLGLILIFGFFGGLGGMAIIAAWWGVWHIVAGLTLATLWGRLDERAAA
jgi:BASS family bile acid:Na+ symporter